MTTRLGGALIPVTLAALALAPAAQAAVLYTPPFLTGGDGLRCDIAYIGTTGTRDVVVTVKQSTLGSPNETLGLPQDSTLGPGQRTTTCQVPSGLAFCKFEVPGGKGSFRAMGCVAAGCGRCSGVAVPAE